MDEYKLDVWEGINAVLREYRRRGRGRGDKPGAGPGGSCICPSCGYKEPHATGKPCNEKVCSKCGAKMTRE